MSIILCSNLHRFGEDRRKNCEPRASTEVDSDASDCESVGAINALDCTGGRYSSLEVAESSRANVSKSFIHWQNHQKNKSTGQVFLV